MAYHTNIKLIINSVLIYLLSNSFGMEICRAQVTYEEAFPNLGFEYPTEIMNAGDNSGRIFVVEQPGRIK
ncbi:MAG: hypothetical protein R3250_14305, partial [Melioribacteraceae bacterium]|nr:hypothetical protein [Melioribacteraceae bacterium]